MRGYVVSEHLNWSLHPTPTHHYPKCPKPIYFQMFNDDSSLYSPPSFQLQAIKNILVSTSVIDSVCKSDDLKKNRYTSRHFHP